MPRRRTSKLLIAEPPLQLLPSLARAVGLNEAVFLQQLHYWLLATPHLKDSEPWVYNTYEEWHRQLDFWSVATIRRIVGSLEERGLVKSTDRFNASKVDRTKWYTIDYDALDRLLKPADDLLNLSSPADQLEQVEALNLSSSDQEINHETNAEREPPLRKTLEELAQAEEEWQRRRATMKRLTGR